MNQRRVAVFNWKATLRLFSGPAAGAWCRPLFFFSTRAVLVNDPFLFHAIDRLEGPAARRTVKGILLGPLSMPAIHIAKIHKSSKKFLLYLSLQSAWYVVILQCKVTMPR
jgi:hypothetical protein